MSILNQYYERVLNQQNDIENNNLVNNNNPNVEVPSLYNRLLGDSREVSPSEESVEEVVQENTQATIRRQNRNVAMILLAFIFIMELIAAMIIFDKSENDECEDFRKSWIIVHLLFYIIFQDCATYIIMVAPTRPYLDKKFILFSIVTICLYISGFVDLLKPCNYFSSMWFLEATIEIPLIVCVAMFGSMIAIVFILGLCQIIIAIFISIILVVCYTFGYTNVQNQINTLLQNIRRAWQRRFPVPRRRARNRNNQQQRRVRENRLPTAIEIDALGSCEYGSDTPIDCSICLEPIVKHDLIRILPCHHIYHIQCIDRWLSIKPLCCSCKRNPWKVQEELLPEFLSSLNLEEELGEDENDDNNINVQLEQAINVILDEDEKTNDDASEIIIDDNNVIS